MFMTEYYSENAWHSFSVEKRLLFDIFLVSALIANQHHFAIGWIVDTSVEV